jgi:hypothetical protein
LDAVEIHSWLEVGTLLDFETGVISENYKFLMWLLVCVEKYYNYLFGVNDNVSLPDKVKLLNLPKKLEEDFLILAHNRNMNAHNIVKIPESFISLMKNGYISLFQQLIKNTIFSKILIKFQHSESKKSQEFIYKVLQEALVSKGKSNGFQSTALSLIKRVQ